MKRKFQFVIYKATDGVRWRCNRGGRIVADSGEAYTKPAGCRRAVKSLTDTMYSHTFVVVDKTKTP